MQERDRVGTVECEAGGFNIGPGLTATFAVLMMRCSSGSFAARLQTELLTGVSQQMFEVLRLQPSVLAFHQQVDELPAGNRRRSNPGGSAAANTTNQERPKPVTARNPRRSGVKSNSGND